MGGASIIPTACFICLLFISPIYVLCVAGSHFRNKRKRRPRYAYLFSLAFSSSIVLMQDKYFSSLSPPGVRGRRQHETLGLRGRDEVQGGWDHLATKGIQGRWGFLWNVDLGTQTYKSIESYSAVLQHLKKNKCCQVSTGNTEVTTSFSSKWVVFKIFTSWWWSWSSPSPSGGRENGGQIGRLSSLVRLSTLPTLYWGIWQVWFWRWWRWWWRPYPSRYRRVPCETNSMGPHVYEYCKVENRALSIKLYQSCE